MGTFLNKIKWQASSFLQEKYRIAKLTLSDVSEVELMAEEATNCDPWGPDARTMTKIAEASFDIDDYWRVVDVLHRRFYNFNWKLWRESYKSLVLLEFLLTHGPENFAEEFQCETDVIQEFTTFKHIDESGFNWGANMQQRSENILNLLRGGETLKEARLKAIRITNEIQGFGNSISSAYYSPSSSSPSPSSSEASRTSSFGSYTTSISTWSDTNDSSNKNDQQYSQGGIPEEKPTTFKATNDNDSEGMHRWGRCRGEESGSLLDTDDDFNFEDEEKDGIMRGICSKLGLSPCKKTMNGDKVAFRSLSDVSRSSTKKKFGRQYSLGH